jgi:hypothetical protein
VLDLLRHGIHHYRSLGWPVVVATSVGLPLLSFVVGLVVVLTLPADYFVRGPAVPDVSGARKVLHLAFVLAKNLAGVLVFLAGFIMALPLVPGPGVLFMLVGLGLVDFPGKRALEQRLLREPHVLSSVNKMRGRFGKPPLRTEERNRPPVVDSDS